MSRVFKMFLKFLWIDKVTDVEFRLYDYHNPIS